MSTQKTSAYQLNQWVKSDRILMEEFNEDNRIIDAALSSISAAAGNCRIAIGSYVGTGLCGESNPCSLTFDFQPLMVFLNTGGANFHGIHEFVSADAMEKMVRVLTALSR